MNHIGISGVFPICGCLFLLSLCVAILWASEHEEQVRDFIVTRILGPLAAEDGDHYE
jgi:hypothetical protein